MTCQSPASDGANLRLSGFTLIEMMAVVLIMGLLLALIAPNLQFGGAAALREQAVDVAQRLELARQLAVTSGQPHRLLVNLETGEYVIESYVRVASDTPLAPANAMGTPAPVLDLSPPLGETSEYRSLGNRFGQSERLDPDFFFEGLETSEGWFEGGRVVLVFDWDGTTSAAALIIGDTEGRSVALEVRPLLDRVAITDETG